MENLIKLDTTLHTGGNGLWSDKATAVHIIGIEVGYLDEDESFGELLVYFDQTSWDVDTDGLIYTDRLFQDELRAMLTANGYDSSDVGYSEQGMQGCGYVSCDVGLEFLQSFKAKHPDIYGLILEESIE